MKLQVDLQGGRRLASLLQDLVHPAGHGLLAGVEALLLDRELPELGEELLQLFMDELELRSRGGRLLVDRLGQLLPVAKRQRGAGSGHGDLSWGRSYRTSGQDCFARLQPTETRRPSDRRRLKAARESLGLTKTTFHRTMKRLGIVAGGERKADGRSSAG